MVSILRGIREYIGLAKYAPILAKLKRDLYYLNLCMQRLFASFTCPRSYTIEPSANMQGPKLRVPQLSSEQQPYSRPLLECSDNRYGI